MHLSVVAAAKYNNRDDEILLLDYCVCVLLGPVSLHAFRDHVKAAIRSLLPTTTLVICGGVDDDALISFDHMIRIRYLSQLCGLRCCCGAAPPGFLRGF
jgi:hypothetical protein